MKKKSFAIIATLGLTLFLTACTLTDNKNTDPEPDNVQETVSEDTHEDKSEDKDLYEPKTTITINGNTYDLIPGAPYSVYEAMAKAEDQSKTEAEDTTDDTTKKDPYAGLAVSKVHSVTVPKGTSYNDIIDKIIEGCKAYPNTYPVIDIVDNNTPGVYQCYWVRLMDDGTYLPLNYAGFTVTITE